MNNFLKVLGALGLITVLVGGVVFGRQLVTGGSTDTRSQAAGSGRARIELRRSSTRNGIQNYEVHLNAESLPNSTQITSITAEIELIPRRDGVVLGVADEVGEDMDLEDSTFLAQVPQRQLGQRICATYGVNGRQVTACATCGNTICEAYEQCTASISSPNGPSTTDCGRLYCPEDCIRNIPRPTHITRPDPLAPAPRSRPTVTPNPKEIVLGKQDRISIITNMHDLISFSSPLIAPTRDGKGYTITISARVKNATSPEVQRALHRRVPIATIRHDSLSLGREANAKLVWQNVLGITQSVKSVEVDLTGSRPTPGASATTPSPVPTHCPVAAIARPICIPGTTIVEQKDRNGCPFYRCQPTGSPTPRVNVVCPTPPTCGPGQRLVATAGFAVEGACTTYRCLPLGASGATALPAYNNCCYDQIWVRSTLGRQCRTQTEWEQGLQAARNAQCKLVPSTSTPFPTGGAVLF